LPAETVAVIGVGGLGIHAVQIAGKLGAGPIIAIDPDPVALARAGAAGATHLIRPDGFDLIGEVRAIVTDGVDLSLDCVGLPGTGDQAVRMLAPGGRAGIIGIGYEAMRLPSSATITWKEAEVKGVYGYTQGELSAVSKLLASGYLTVDHAISATYPLMQINDALEHFRSRHGSPVRILVDTRSGL
jgi:threonine dehydrogenase-like Zn-dependent dehydrogenase